jgi:hypothetical protein
MEPAAASVIFREIRSIFRKLGLDRKFVRRHSGGIAAENQDAASRDLSARILWHVR